MTLQQPQQGDIIQIGYRLLGVEDIQWGTHQFVIDVFSDGTPIYRPREAKVDKFASYWRYPIESQDRIIKDLKRYANPKTTKEYLKKAGATP